MMNKIKRFTKKIAEDKKSILVIKIDNFRLSIFKLFSTACAKFICSVRGIKLSKHCVFFGVPHFRRFRFSVIEIGGNCLFRSDQTSNLIGVNRKCIFSTHDKDAIISIGNNCGFSGVTIGAAKKIILGNNVLCGANVVITDFDWHSDISNTHPESVIIGDNVWIGLNVVVLKGVKIGKNSVIGANSLVVKDIPENVIAGGNPCKVLKVKG